jgi:hypothetical protein
VILFDNGRQINTWISPSILHGYPHSPPLLHPPRKEIVEHEADNKGVTEVLGHLPNTSWRASVELVSASKALIAT